MSRYTSFSMVPQFGTVGEWLGALGSVGAAVTALWIAYRGRKAQEAARRHDLARYESDRQAEEERRQQDRNEIEERRSEDRRQYEEDRAWQLASRVSARYEHMAVFVNNDTPVGIQRWTLEFNSDEFNEPQVGRPALRYGDERCGSLRPGEDKKIEFEKGEHVDYQDKQELSLVFQLPPRWSWHWSPDAGLKLWSGPWNWHREAPHDG